MTFKKLKASTFIALFALLVFLFAESAFGILIQLARNSTFKGLRNNWNALIVGLSYILLGFISLGYYMHRSSRSRRRLTRLEILRPSGPNLPTPVAWHAGAEYARACAIAFATLPRVEKRDGWGSPGTAFEGVRFRTALLDTITPLCELARQVVPHLPRLAPRQPLLEHMLPLLPLIPAREGEKSYLHEWVEAVEKARDLSREVQEEDFMIGMQAAGRLAKIFDEYSVELLAALSDSDSSMIP